VRAGKSAEAIVILELNAEQYPQDATAAFALGQLYARAGNREKAIASYERALRIEPDNRQAQQALQRLRGG
jgi:cytochrome c-type biogenesis protein CcmH/NrfG